MKFRNTLLVILLVAGAGYTGWLLGRQRLVVSFRNYQPAVVLNKEPVREGSVDFGMFWKVWDKVAANYVDKSALVPSKMIEGAISGMVEALGDPYTVYLPKKQNEESKADLGGAFEGVGIQLGYKDKQLAVMTPLDGTPAKKAGVKSGDLIIHIKDELKKIDRDADGIPIPEAVNLIRGPKGTVVELTLVRGGATQPMKVSLVRDTIVVKSVTIEFPEQEKGKVAVLKLNRFGDRTQDEWLEAIAQITNHTPRVTGVVLDLRNNPGGYLDGAVYLSGEFLTDGKVIVVQQRGDGTKEENKVTRNGRLLKMPLVVLVNEGSASAAEIMAGALQDHKRAKIVGVKSFGKGSVQQPEDFGDGSGIHVTIAKWLRPSGEWIDKTGIIPDAVVEMTATDSGDLKDDAQLQKAIELL